MGEAQGGREEGEVRSAVFRRSGSSDLRELGTIAPMRSGGLVGALGGQGSLAGSDEVLQLADSSGHLRI